MTDTEDQAAVVRRLSAEIERLQELYEQERATRCALQYTNAYALVAEQRGEEIERLQAELSRAREILENRERLIMRLLAEHRVIPGTNIADAGTPSY